MDENTALIRVIGRVKQERKFTLGELLKMDIIETGENIIHACGDGEAKGRLPACRGVLLCDIINEAEVLVTEHNDTKKMYVVVEAADGYRTVFSWQELFNTTVGKGVIVILEKAERKLYEEQGVLDLFSASDFLTGPRYVKKVATVEIVMLEA